MARLRAVRYRGIMRWSPLLALAIGHFAEDPDSVLRAATLAISAALVAWLELRDKVAARTGRLRLVPQCDSHERIVDNARRLAVMQAENAELRAAVADWDMALQAAGLMPQAPAWRAPRRSG